MRTRGVRRRTRRCIVNDGPLILLDVDETLIDRNYELTAPRDDLTAVLRYTEVAGAIVGLNSDSALATLERRAHAIGIGGPIIAERGALVQTERGAPPEVLVPEATRFRELRSRFLDALMRGDRSFVYWAMLSAFVNDLAKPKALPLFHPRTFQADIAVLVNGSRMCSCSFYVRKRTWNGEWSWASDDVALDAVIAILVEAGEEIPDLWSMRDVDRNPAYGICIVHHKDTQKPRAIDWILERAGTRPVYMIGNSASDDLRDPRVTQCAVGNARPEYKARCLETGGYVAECDLTAGVIELLERITHA